MASPEPRHALDGDVTLVSQAQAHNIEHYMMQAREGGRLLFLYLQLD
jgi:hypothetical protein